MNTLTTVCSPDKFIKTFQLCDGNIINCLIFDTAGQERFDALNFSYYKKADAVLLVYDITDKKTFDKIKNYYAQKIKEYCKKDIPILLLGNKTDLEKENAQEKKREVTYEEGIDLALEENYEFKESSCLQNINVAGAFENLIERWNFDNHKTLKINSENNSKKDTNKKSKQNLDNSFHKTLTQLNLDKEVEEVKLKRNRSLTTIDKNKKPEEKKGAFTLDNKKTKKKNDKKCCK